MRILERVSAGDVQQLSHAFSPKANSLNFLRLSLASAVIVSHSWPLGGFGEDPRWHDHSAIGDWAVAGFFAVSGWLIVGSRVNTPLGAYLVRRTLRIYPGFLVCLLMIATVFAPLADLLGSGTYVIRDGISFVLADAGLYLRAFRIGDTLAENPYPGMWNGQMWTLFHEFLCYLAIGFVVTVTPKRHLRWVVLAALSAATMCQLAIAASVVAVPSMIETPMRLATFFFAGSVLFLFKDRVPCSAGLAALSALVLVVMALTGPDPALGSLAIAYLCMWLSVRLPFHKVGRRNDISYGMYIYAFPVQQLLGVLGVQRWGVLGFMVCSIVLTVPFAMFSWFMVEKPAMQLVRRPKSKDAIVCQRSRNSPGLTGF